MTGDVWGSINVRSYLLRSHFVKFILKMIERKEQFVVHAHCLSCPTTHPDCQRGEFTFKDGEKVYYRVLAVFLLRRGHLVVRESDKRGGSLRLRETPPPNGQGLDYGTRREMRK